MINDRETTSEVCSGESPSVREPENTAEEPCGCGRTSGFCGYDRSRTAQDCRAQRLDRSLSASSERSEVKEELEELVTGSKHALKAMLENRCEECGGTGKVSYHYYDEVEIEEECDCRKAS